MEANQRTTNINKKNDTLPTEKLIICETVFCGLATGCVKIVIEMPTAENSISYRSVIDRNCYGRALKKRDI
jgi:hypothetical protein